MLKKLVAAAAVVFGLAAHADVRVEITRDLPEEKQLVVMSFKDDEDFQMWMGMKMEDEQGCDPYVTEIKIFRNWEPEQQKF